MEQVAPSFRPSFAVGSRRFKGFRCGPAGQDSSVTMQGLKHSRGVEKRPSVLRRMAGAALSERRESSAAGDAQTAQATTAKQASRSEAALIFGPGDSDSVIRDSRAPQNFGAPGPA